MISCFISNNCNFRKWNILPISDYFGNLNLLQLFLCTQVVYLHNGASLTLLCSHRYDILSAMHQNGICCHAFTFKFVSIRGVYNNTVRSIFDANIFLWFKSKSTKLEKFSSQTKIRQFKELIYLDRRFWNWSYYNILVRFLYLFLLFFLNFNFGLAFILFLRILINHLI